MTQLLSVLNDVGLNLDKNIQTDVIYLDFAKAFDSVDHNILLAKLDAYGISGNLLSWRSNYLSGRFQRVVHEGTSSQWAPVTSGVPQGSLPGHFMFVIFINDLPDAANGEVNTALYADDSKIFGAVKCVHDCEVVQTTLSNMDELNGRDITTSNLTPLNVKILSYYSLNNVQLDRVAEETFSSPEPTILLACGRDRELWPDPIF